MKQSYTFLLCGVHLSPQQTMFQVIFRTIQICVQTPSLHPLCITETSRTINLMIHWCRTQKNYVWNIMFLGSISVQEKRPEKKLCFAILLLNGLGSFLYIRLQLQIFGASLKRGVQLCFFMHSLNWFCIICKWNCSWPWWKKFLSSWSYKEPLHMKPLNWVCIKNGTLKEQNGYGTNSMQGCGRVASLSIIEQIESESLSVCLCAETSTTFLLYFYRYDM